MSIASLLIMAMQAAPQGGMSPIEAVVSEFVPYAACISAAADRYAPAPASAEEIAVTAQQDCHSEGIKAKEAAIATATDLNRSLPPVERIPLEDVTAQAVEILEVRSKQWAIARVVRARASAGSQSTR